MRCISGIHRPDAGHIVFDGAELDFHSPEDAREAGIETVHQNLALVEDLTVWQNLFLNRELVRRRSARSRFLDRARRCSARPRRWSRPWPSTCPRSHSRVRRLSGGQRQAVAICRAAGFSSKLVIMDEPTAALGVQETAKVEELIRGCATRATPSC